MDLKEFYETHEYLYHLTDKANLDGILKSGTLLSTLEIAEGSYSKAEAKSFLRKKREGHITLKIGKQNYKIRDQRPISMVVLGRSLSGNLVAEDFLELLNMRVFWWPTLDRLSRHYERYKTEYPVIIRVKSEELLSANPNNTEFCHLNSGATRCHPFYKGNAPTRGKDTFLNAEKFNLPTSSVAEVTFLNSCKLPKNVWLGSSPNSAWKKHER